MLVIADTSVFNYLLLLDQLALLPALYTRVVIPTVVLTVELPHPDSPTSVRAWVEHLTVDPPRLERRAPTRTPASDLLLLEAGARDAILLAQELQADLVLMDDKDGRKAAERRVLTVYGTIGVFTRAAERGLVDLSEMFTRLLTTNFRIDERILQDALARDAARKAAAQVHPPTPRRRNHSLWLANQAPLPTQIIAHLCHRRECCRGCGQRTPHAPRIPVLHEN